MLTSLFYVFASFAVLWIGAGLAISGIEKISKKLKITSFLVSFFALGVLTSVSEISVAYFSIVDKTPSVSVGNLVGGSIVLTLLIIPLFAIIRDGVKFDERSERIDFKLAYLVISLPAFLIFDGVLGYVDGLILIFSFVYLAFTISSRNTIIEKLESVLYHTPVSFFKESFKILTGVFMVVLSCKFIVDTLVYYAGVWSIPPFLLGLILLGLGTNLPEVTILLRSLIFKKEDIAIGDYIGSAVINTLTLGFLVFFNRAPVLIHDGLGFNIALLPIGAFTLLLFTRNKRLERIEGLILLSLYIFFVLLEILI